MRLLLLCLCISGCVCFHPVDEVDGGAGGGGGTGGGSGGGSAAGGGAAGGGAAGGGHMGPGDGGCNSPADCPGSEPSIPFCGAAAGAGWSCVDSACLWECNGGRTCEVTNTPDGGCIHCDTLGTECRDDFCPANTMMTGHIEHSTCATLQVMAPVSVSTSGACIFNFSVTGTSFGDFQQVGGGDFLANFPALGGTCTGTFLPTNAERWEFNCPGCEFDILF
jgi:hypothetical protein